MHRLTTWDFLAGAVALVVPLAIYLASVSPNVSFWDTGEMQTVPYILGIAHPTGFPAFTLVGWLFTHVVVYGSVAWRMSAMSALAMAFAARGVYALAREFDVVPPVACASGLLFAVGDVVWSRGARTEVHALAAAFLVWTLVFGVAFARSGKAQPLYLGALMFGLGVATHPVVSLLVPGLVVLLARRYRDLRPTRAIAAIGIVAACGLLYLYLPLRSSIVTAQHLDPLASIGLPPGRPFWDYDHPATWDGFHREIAGSDFNVGAGTSGIFAFDHYRETIQSYASRATLEFGGVGIGAVVIGLVYVLRDRTFLALGALLATSIAIPFALNYHDEADVDRYLIGSYAVLSVFAGHGAQSLLRDFLKRPGALGPALASVAVLGACAGLVAQNSREFAQHDDLSAVRWVDRVRAETPTNAIVVSFWAYATPLAYASYVEHSFDDRLVEAQWIGDDRNYLPQWLAKRPVYVVAQYMPSIPGYRFTPTSDEYPFIYRVSR
jgi:hypothetical protein